MTARRLTALDWIQAGFRALGTGGADRVRAEPLARDLKVSKGSFYWHFDNVPDFHQQMIAHWETAATAQIIAEIEALGGAPADRLSALFDLIISDLDHPYGGPMVEVSIRDWARRAPLVAAAQDRVDQARGGYLSDLFTQAGYDPETAQRQARLLYAAYLGSLGMPASDRRAVIRDLVALFPPAPG